MNTPTHAKQIRALELKHALPYLPNKASILEIGAEAGWQASELDKLGHEVVARDVADSQHSKKQIYLVIPYDGEHLLFGAATSDVEFRSTALEHIRKLNALEGDLHRVLKESGVAVHIVPSSMWRLSTSLTHHIYIARLCFRIIFKREQTTACIRADSKNQRIAFPTLFKLVYVSPPTW
jgi:hypothetical protein